MSWRQMILYRPELVGLVTYIYKIVPHTHTGFYVPLVLRLARGGRGPPRVRLVVPRPGFEFGGRRASVSHEYDFGISFILFTQLLADTG